MSDRFRSRARLLQARRGAADGPPPHAHRVLSATLEIPLDLARRLTITKQRLAGPKLPANAKGIVDVALDIGCLQIDPIRVVEQPQYLIPWSRVGYYKHAVLDKALYEDRTLFHFWAHAASLVPTMDYPIHQVM